ncbi:MAG TPA: hypothetical protein VK034_23185, partial [Enhygromyxa sp.]|nr:hypothetical protein [Enhygromyxa sp.]
RLRRVELGGPRKALLGVVAGLALLLGWLYGKPEVASVLPSDDYGFGGLRPRLIRAGGNKARSEPAPAAVAPAAESESDSGPEIEEEPVSTPIAPAPLAPRRDGAEPAPMAPEGGLP